MLSNLVQILSTSVLILLNRGKTPHRYLHSFYKKQLQKESLKHLRLEGDSSSITVNPSPADEMYVSYIHIHLFILHR